MIIGVARERLEGERRVSVVPESAKRLVKGGREVLVERGAGEGAGIPDALYAEAGARLVEREEVSRGADIVTRVRIPDQEDVAAMRKGTVLIGMLEPDVYPEMIEALAAREISALSLERVPRIARAQSMDVLSSMSTVAGYKAALMAADRLPRFFPLLMTAAGTIPPAKVLIIGAGVVGLQAVATARRLGAKVEAFDPRPAVREQVESLGARFVGAELLDDAVETEGGYAREQTPEERARQQEALKDAVAQCDVILCSALVAGRKAPEVISEEMVRSMQPGSVIIDLAAEQGGNCALTEAHREVVQHGVTIYGPVNVPSMMPFDASRMFSRNVSNLLKLVVDKEGKLTDLAEDEITRHCLCTHQGVSWSGGEARTGAAAS